MRCGVSCATACDDCARVTPDQVVRAEGDDLLNYFRFHMRKHSFTQLEAITPCKRQLRSRVGAGSGKRRQPAHMPISATCSLMFAAIRSTAVVAARRIFSRFHRMGRSRGREWEHGKWKRLWPQLSRRPLAWQVPMGHDARLPSGALAQSGRISSLPS